jgi:ribosome maturation factor RimP
MSSIRAEIEEIVQASAKQAGIYILDIKVQTHKNKTVFDISADAERALTIDDYAVLSRSIDDGIQNAYPDLENYELRVGSPGIERPLEHRWQFVKNIGRPLRFMLTENGEEKSVQLRLRAVSENALTFEDGKGNTVEYPAGAVRNAVVQIEF